MSLLFIQLVEIGKDTDLTDKKWVSENQYWYLSQHTYVVVNIVPKWGSACWKTGGFGQQMPINEVLAQYRVDWLDSRPPKKKKLFSQTRQVSVFPGF